MKRPQRPSSNGLQFKPALNGLETRITPATLTVTNLLDDTSAGSLRSAVTTANTNGTDDEIVFAGGAASGTVTLKTALTVAEAGKSLTITGGPSRQDIEIAGAGIDRLFVSDSKLVLKNLTLSNGVTPAGLSGGAIRNTSVLEVNNCLFFGNRADLNGGAISSSSLSTSLTISDSWIHGNTAKSNGGGISIVGGTLSVANSTISLNTATDLDGGGIYASSAVGTTVVQSTVSGNKAGDDGGGIYVDGTGKADLFNSTVAKNTAGVSVAAGNGGGIRHGTGASTVNVSSSIVSDNTLMGTGKGLNLSGAFNNLLSDVIGNQPEGLTVSMSAAGSALGDPLLSAFAPSGGKNPTHRLKFGSPAIDKGLALPTTATAPTLPATFDGTTDARGKGFVRNYAGKGVDVGATEFGAGLGEERVAVGSDAGIDTVVNVYDRNGALLRTIVPYGVGFRGGVRVGTGDFTGDGVQDIVTAAGPGGGPNVKIFDGVTFQEIRSFYAYTRAFQGGVYFGVGDYNGDGVADLATAAGPGGGPHVQVLDGTKLNQIPDSGLAPESVLLGSFYAFVEAFKGGVTISSGDFNGDGVADIAIAAGPGGGPHIRLVDGKLLRLTQSDGQISPNAALVGAPKLDNGDFLSSFYGFGDANFSGGVVLTTGDIDGDGLPDLIFGDATKGMRVSVRNAKTGNVDQTFSAFEAGYTGGVRLAAADSDGNGNEDKIVIGRATGSSQVRVVKGASPTDAASFDTAVFPGFSGGVYVG